MKKNKDPWRKSRHQKKPDTKLHDRYIAKLKKSMIWHGWRDIGRGTMVVGSWIAHLSGISGEGSWDVYVDVTHRHHGHILQMVTGAHDVRGHPSTAVKWAVLEQVLRSLALPAEMPLLVGFPFAEPILTIWGKGRAGGVT